MNTNYYSQMGPSREEPFFAFNKVVSIDAAEMIEPATPGKAFDISELPQ